MINYDFYEIFLGLYLKNNLIIIATLKKKTYFYVVFIAEILLEILEVVKLQFFNNVSVNTSKY